MRKRILVPSFDYDLSDEPIVSVPSAQLTGLLTMELIDGNTGQIKERYEFPNMIPNSFLDAIGAGTTEIESCRNYMAVGTGSTLPAPTDTTLEYEVGRTSFQDGISDVYGYVSGVIGSPGESGSYHYHNRTRVFLESEAIGELSEVGMFNAAGGGVMLFRTLIRDDTGSIVTITKTAVDQLRIVHQIRLYPPDITGSVSGTFVMAEVSYSYTASGLEVDNRQLWGWYGDVGGGDGMLWGLGTWAHNGHALQSCSAMVHVTGTYVEFNGGVGELDVSPNLNDSYSLYPYSNGDFYRDGQIDFQPSTANFGPGGIKGFILGWRGGQQGSWQVLIDPPILKDDIKKLQLTFRGQFTASSLL